MNGFFNSVYIETHDHRLAPDFKRMIARGLSLRAVLGKDTNMRVLVIAPIR